MASSLRNDQTDCVTSCLVIKEVVRIEVQLCHTMRFHVVVYQIPLLTLVRDVELLFKIVEWDTILND